MVGTTENTPGSTIDNASRSGRSVACSASSSSRLRPLGSACMLLRALVLRLGALTDRGVLDSRDVLAGAVFANVRSDLDVLADGYVDAAAAAIASVCVAGGFFDRLLEFVERRHTYLQGPLRRQVWCHSTGTRGLGAAADFDLVVAHAGF